MRLPMRWRRHSAVWCKIHLEMCLQMSTWMKSTVPQVMRTKYQCHLRPRIYPVFILYIPLRFCNIATTIQISEVRKTDMKWDDNAMSYFIHEEREAMATRARGAVCQQGVGRLGSLNRCSGNRSTQQVITLEDVLHCNTQLSQQRAKGSHLIITLFTEWFPRQRFVTLLHSKKSSP